MNCSQLRGKGIGQTLLGVVVLFRVVAISGGYDDDAGPWNVFSTDHLVRLGEMSDRMVHTSSTSSGFIPFTRRSMLQTFSRSHTRQSVGSHVRRRAITHVLVRRGGSATRKVLAFAWLTVLIGMSGHAMAAGDDSALPGAIQFGDLDLKRTRQFRDGSAEEVDPYQLRRTLGLDPTVAPWGLRLRPVRRRLSLFICWCSRRRSPLGRWTSR